MQADLPHTLYLDRKKKGKGGKDYKYNPEDPAIEKQREALRKREERDAAKRRGEIPYTTEELFK